MDMTTRLLVSGSPPVNPWGKFVLKYQNDEKWEADMRPFKCKCTVLMSFKGKSDKSKKKQTQ